MFSTARQVPASGTPSRYKPRGTGVKLLIDEHRRAVAGRHPQIGEDALLGSRRTMTQRNPLSSKSRS